MSGGRLSIEQFKAPDLSVASEAMARSGDAFNRGMSNAQDLLGKYQSGLEANGDAELTQALAGARTEEEYDKILGSLDLNSMSLTDGMRARLMSGQRNEILGYERSRADTGLVGANTDSVRTNTGIARDNHAYTMGGREEQNRLSHAAVLDAVEQLRTGGTTGRTGSPEETVAMEVMNSFTPGTDPTPEEISAMVRTALTSTAPSGAGVTTTSLPPPGTPASETIARADSSGVPEGFDWSKYAVGGAASRPDSFTGLQPEYAARAARLMMAADEAGIDLRVTSAYRSSDVQANIISSNMSKYGLGHRRQEWLDDVAAMGPEAAGQKWRPIMRDAGLTKWVAMPGGSDHQRGTAIDFADKNGSLIRDPNSREATWIKENAGQFGLTVPMSWEPWQIGMADGSTPATPGPSGTGPTTGPASGNSPGLPAGMEVMNSGPVSGPNGGAPIQAPTTTRSRVTENPVGPTSGLVDALTSTRYGTVAGSLGILEGSYKYGEAGRAAIEAADREAANEFEAQILLDSADDSVTSAEAIQRGNAASGGAATAAEQLAIRRRVAEETADGGILSGALLTIGATGISPADMQVAETTLVDIQERQNRDPFQFAQNGAASFKEDPIASLRQALDREKIPTNNVDLEDEINTLAARAGISREEAAYSLARASEQMNWAERNINVFNWDGLAENRAYEFALENFTGDAAKTARAAIGRDRIFIERIQGAATRLGTLETRISKMLGQGQIPPAELVREKDAAKEDLDILYKRHGNHGEGPPRAGTVNSDSPPPGSAAAALGRVSGNPEVTGIP